MKDTLIKKLTDRNVMLELLMKKSVKIMKNPLVMKDAFRKFNFNKYIYTDDGKGGVEVRQALSDCSDRTIH